MLDKPPRYERLKSFSYPGEMFDVIWDFEEDKMSKRVQPNTIRPIGKAATPNPNPSLPGPVGLDTVNARKPDTTDLQQPQAAATPRKVSGAVKAIARAEINIS